MRGVVYIERENTDGDRGIVRTLYVEGFLSSEDPMVKIKEATNEALKEGGAYTIRARHDDGWKIRTVYRVSHGDRR